MSRTHRRYHWNKEVFKRNMKDLAVKIGGALLFVFIFGILPGINLDYIFSLF